MEHRSCWRLRDLLTLNPPTAENKWGLLLIVANSAADRVESRFFKLAQKQMNRERIRIGVRGMVQGVGFRPFTYRLASELRLTGWVQNSPQGVFIEAEGPRGSLNDFLRRIENEKPRLAIIRNLESHFLDPIGDERFEIRQSNDRGSKRTLVLPDIAICADCKSEIFNPKDRRYLYPFTNCTNCGPRFSIIESLPYDRSHTAMKCFSMCDACRTEYSTPGNRRFHAQPNACPACGPQLELWDCNGKMLGQFFNALFGGLGVLRNGQILALKGIGGFQLLVDARNDEAVKQLRHRKRREEKPFAVMYPSLARLEQDCLVGELERQLLNSPEAPIVLLKRRSKQTAIAPAVAPRNPYLGVMLPYSPLHHILMHELDFPIVATSGNLSDEPICTDEQEALERLHDIADVFLVHNRPIIRPVDDSVVQALLGREQVLRRARGYAPLPIEFSCDDNSDSILATGAHVKNSIALSVGRDVFISQHIGDLASPQTLSTFHRVASDLQELYEPLVRVVATDLHPEYLSTKHATKLVPGRQVTPLESPSYIGVQHHHAHVVGCMAENGIEPPLLGIAWDGSGYGLDDTIWGGEFLLVDETSFSRVAHLRQFRLPGGEIAIRQPWRIALSMLYGTLGHAALAESAPKFARDATSAELAIFQQTLTAGINAPLTSSAGRIFDAVASLTGLCRQVSFEGQAAMELEFAIEPEVDLFYPFQLNKESVWVADWRPMISQIVTDLHIKTPVKLIAAKFHNTLVEMIVAVAREIGVIKVVLTGGCFQNRYLTERSVYRLREEGFQPYWHQRVPPNDGGIAFGQIVAAKRVMAKRRTMEECSA